MLFVTEKFLLFFIVVFLVYWSVPGNFRRAVLILSSLLFYATWSIPFTFHLLFVVTVNYTVMEIWKKYPKKWIFVLLQIANVCNIAFFKYFYLLADAVGIITGIEALRDPFLRDEHQMQGREIFLPLAISFYTFQIMAYGIDIYRNVYTKNHSFREVLLFKAFFPQLIAGPIMRSSELLPQVEKMAGFSAVSPEMLRKGLWLIIAGTIKKLLVADQLAIFIVPVLQGNPADYSFFVLWPVIFACMAMLYADFSAYSDLARGLALLLGFDIPINFKAPFFMKSLSDFWRRWHLTFSLWIRDYIYFPLGGSKVHEYRNYFNLTVTFFIGGLWHGASYTFVLWGIFIGLFLSLESFLYRRGYEEWPASIPGRIFRIVSTWLFFAPATVLFFAPDISWGIEFIGGMFSFMRISGIELANWNIFFWAILAVFLFHAIEEWPDKFSRLRRHYDRTLLIIAALLVIITLNQFAGPGQDFFYFQF